MTGKNLDGTTAGIAYVNSACEVERGVSLSERSYGTTISAIVMAHELGHNFGAPHDGEASEVCASVSGGYIMSPSISGFASFSQCSIGVMSRVLEESACVTPADYADAALVAGSTVNAEGGVPFVLPFAVRSAGTKAAEDVSFTVTLPANAGLALDAAGAEGVSCSVSGLTASCDFGALAAGQERGVSITARATLPGTVTARARVSASNDLMTSNNSRDLGVSIRSGVDAAVTVTDGCRRSGGRRAADYLYRSAQPARAAGAQCGAVAESQPGGEHGQHAGRELHGQRLLRALQHRRDCAGCEPHAHGEGEHVGGGSAVRGRQCHCVG